MHCDCTLRGWRKQDACCIGPESALEKPYLIPGDAETGSIAMIYFDNAATTLQKPPSVPAAMAGAVGKLGSPGRGGHRAALAAAEEAYVCRKLASRLFGLSDPGRVVFCMNATHALNLAIKSLAGRGDRVVISGYEHNAVLRPLNRVGAAVAVASAPPFQPDRQLEAFRKELLPGTKLAVVNHVSNVFGSVQPLAEIADLCSHRGIPLVVDASQSAGVLPLDLERLNAAFIAMPGHKGLYGPQGTGLLLCGVRGEPLLEGGSGSDSRNPEMPQALPDRLEAGTHNMPGIAGLRAGMEFVKKTTENRILRHEQRILRLLAELVNGEERIKLYRAASPQLQTGVLSFTVQGEDPEVTAEKLSRRGIAVRAGLHCAPLAHDTAGSTGTVRVSFSVFNTEAEVRRLAKVLRDNLP